MKLNEIASIKTGLVVNRKQAVANADVVEEYKQLTLKAINTDATVDIQQLDTFLSKEKLKSENLTQKNDIIVRLSSPYTAVLIDEESENLLFSSNFIVIRCDSKYILPEYLQWLLNGEQIRKEILISTSSSAFGAIKPSFFGELEIDLLPIDKQAIIADINQLAKKENILLSKLKEEKQKYYLTLINKIQKEMRKKQ